MDQENENQTKFTKSINGADWSSETIITTIVEGIAELEGGEPMDATPLYYSIDTDALSSLFEPSSNRRVPVELTFTHSGYKIQITSEETVRVTVTPADV